MRKNTLILSAALLLGALCQVCAGTYSVSLPSVTGDYLGVFPGFSRKFADISFGSPFQSIQSVSLRWSGFIGQGLSYEHSHPPLGNLLPHGGRFDAYVDRYMIRGPGGGGSSFEVDSPCGYIGPFTDLYDGTAHIRVEFWETAHSGSVISFCDAEIYSAELIVVGTPVPEPASLLALLCGVAGMAIRHRR